MRLFAFVLPALALLASACGGTGHGGLTNVPSPSRIELTTAEQHDVIANGPESCPPVEGASDPLPNRAGRCPEAPKKAAKTPDASKAPSP